MKTMEKKILALVGATACCFSFGLAQRQAGAMPACITDLRAILL